MMPEPQQPPDHPAPEDAAKPATPPSSNGVPPAAADGDAKPTGLPTSDRHETETAAVPTKP